MSKATSNILNVENVRILPSENDSHRGYELRISHTKQNKLNKYTSKL